MEKKKKKLLSYINNEIISDITNYNKEPHGRRYNEKDIVFGSITCLFGYKCYSFMRKRIPLLSVSYLQELYWQKINDIIKSLFTIDQIQNLIDVYKLSGSHASIAIDVASFQKIVGEDLLRRFPLLEEISGLQIQKDKIYSNIFVFLIQHISPLEHTIQITIMIKENGNAYNEITKIIKNIISYLKMYNIFIDFICTDCDQNYDTNFERVYNF